MKRIYALRRNILLYRLLLVFGANGLMTTVIYFFFTSIKGFSPAQTLFLVGVAVLAKALFELPTGVIADKFSRKYSILIGYTVLLISWIGILLTTSFWSILLFAVIGGIGGSFVSGADDALLYDSLKELKKSDQFKSVYSLSESIELIAFAATILVGGVLGGINLYLPVLVNIFALTFSIIISYLLIEPSMTKEGEKIEQTGYILHTKKSIETIFSKSGVRSGLLNSFLALALVLAVFKSTKNILSPILNQYGFVISTIGLVVSVVILIKAFGAYIASKLSKRGNEKKEVVTGLTLCITGLFLITLIQVPLVQLLIFSVIISLDNVILTNLKTIVNDQIESSRRSTVLSLLSLFARSTEMLFLTSFGWIIDLYQFKIALWFTTGWLVFSTLMLVIFTKEKK